MLHKNIFQVNEITAITIKTYRFLIKLPTDITLSGKKTK